MTTVRVSLALIASTLIACGDRRSAGRPTDELSKIPAETFSHGDPTLSDDEKCAGQDGVLISSTSIGPVHLGRPLRSLRKSCDIALLKVPASIAIRGPVMGVSVVGGLIVFTVSGNDSVIETAGTSSPAFRTETGLGVSSKAQVLINASTLCFRRDSVKVIEVFVSRRSLSCSVRRAKPAKRGRRRTHRRH